MISASTEFKNKVYYGAILLTKVLIILSDETEIELDNSGIMQNGLSIKQSKSNNSTFEVGTVNSSELNLKLVNFDNRYEGTDFTDAEVRVSIGVELAPDRIEYVNKGVYFVDKQTFGGGTVDLVAYDKIADFDKDYTGSMTGTAYYLISQIALKYGINFVSFDMNNQNVNITIPENEGISYTDREIIGYICQITGNNAFMDNVNRLVVKWYDFDKIENFNFIEAKWENEDVIEAGDFADMQDVVVCIQAGTFIDIGSSTGNNPIILTTLFGIPKFDIEDVVITGVKVTGHDGEEVLSGTDKYCIKLSNNPLAIGHEQEYANMLGQVVIGNRFRALSTSIIKNPLIEAGDVAIIQYKGKLYATVLTNVDFSIGNNLKISCGAESPGMNTSKVNTEAAKAYKASVIKTEQLLTTYDAAMQALTSLMSMSFGVYKIEERQPDGSVIFYMASKPTLAESYGSSVWKMTANTFTVTDNYQGDDTEWRAGVDSQGNFVVNILSAIGINFDWANGGTLRLGGYNNTNGVLNVYDENNTQIGYWNNTGLHLNKGSLSIGNNFEVDTSGNLTASNADINGKIEADSGNIGLWTIGQDSDLAGGLVYDSTSSAVTGGKYLYIKCRKSSELGAPYQIISLHPTQGLYTAQTNYSSGTLVCEAIVSSTQVALRDRLTGENIYMHVLGGGPMIQSVVPGVGTKALLWQQDSVLDVGKGLTTYVDGVRVVCQSTQPAAVSGKTIVWIQT